ncbi:hypothetical protein ADK58_16910 [Streptomyces sp. XY152]|nr:hypothetical protein ADK58_16910 [Streptomyces sp. XY152]
MTRHERLYADGAYAPKGYRRRITRRVHEPAEEYGLGPTGTGTPRRVRAVGPAGPAGSPAFGPNRLTLLEERSSASGDPIGSRISGTRSDGAPHRDDAA